MEEVVNLGTLPDEQGGYPLRSPKFVPYYSQHVNSQFPEIYLNLCPQSTCNIEAPAFRPTMVNMPIPNFLTSTEAGTVPTQHKLEIEEPGVLQRPAM